MASNTFKCNYLTPLHFKELNSIAVMLVRPLALVCEEHLSMSSQVKHQKLWTLTGYRRPSRRGHMLI